MCHFNDKVILNVVNIDRGYNGDDQQALRVQRRVFS